jgi:hypothetical protein
MALADALIALASDWLNVRERISPSDLERARRLLAAAVHGGAWEPDTLLLSLLSNEPANHPAWRALRESPARRTAPATFPVETAAAALRLVIERDAVVPQAGDIGEPDAERVEVEAEERIWAVPTLPVNELTHRYNGLLVLDRAHAGYAPLFQFDEKLELLPTVAEVNFILGADTDPWGVASWWLTPHAALRAIPADELRTGTEERVLAAATAAGAVG